MLIVVLKPHVRELELGDTFCALATTEMSAETASESEKRKTDWDSHIGKRGEETQGSPPHLPSL